MLKLERIPGKLRRELHGTFQNGRQLQKLRETGDPVGLRLAAALETTLSAELDETAKQWVSKIEAVRQKLLVDDTVVSGVDFGAGSPGDARTLAEMSRGVTWQRSVRSVARASKSQRWGTLLMQVVRETHPQHLLELGTCCGISAAYQAAGIQGRTDASLVTLEGAESLSQLSRSNLESLGLEGVQVVVGDFASTLGGVLSSLGRVDYAYIDGHHDGTATIDYFERILPRVPAGGVLIFDDIRWSAGMQRAWKKISAHAKVSLAIDCFQVGICVVGSGSVESQHFTVSIE